MEADKDGDGKLDFQEFAMMVSNTVRSFVHSFRHKSGILGVGTPCVGSWLPFVC